MQHVFVWTFDGIVSAIVCGVVLLVILAALATAAWERVSWWWRARH